MELGRKHYSFNNAVDPVTAIADAISGIGQGVSGVFGYFEEKEAGKTAKTQAEYEALMQLQQRKKITYIVLGAVSLTILAVGSFIIIKKVK